MQPLLEGQDCIACAKTGSGKTAAFALPMLQRLAKDPYGIFGVILTPTRELAFQISEQLRALGKPMGLRDAVIVGGLDMMKQAQELAHRPHIIVATPGRLADHLQSTDTVSLARVKVLVLDEADRLLTNSTLQTDLATIFAALPATRQTLLFSATMPKELPTNITLREPVFRYEAESATATVDQLVQEYLFIPSQVRHCYLLEVVKTLEAETTAIIFTSTCRSCAEIELVLRELDFRCVALHSMMPQSQRIGSLAKFRSGLIPILIATDVASRGLDIPTVKTVINFNVPKNPDDYIHRVGRTARAGRGGKALTLIGERDVELVHAIEARTGAAMTLCTTVDEKNVLAAMTEVAMARRAASLQMIEQGFDEAAKARPKAPRAKRAQNQHGDAEAEADTHQPSSTPASAPAPAPSASVSKEEKKKLKKKRSE